MHRLAIASLAAIIAAAPTHVQAGQTAARTFFGMAAYYSGHGAGRTGGHKTVPVGTPDRVTNP